MKPLTISGQINDYDKPNIIPDEPIPADPILDGTQRKRRRSIVDHQIKNHQAGYETSDESGNGFNF